LASWAFWASSTASTASSGLPKPGPTGSWRSRAGRSGSASHRSLAQGYAKRLLISGVNEKTSREQISSLNPGQRRLFDCCVDLDYRARNTIGNAIETRRWTEENGFDAIIVVTSNYHMPRTLVELDHGPAEPQKIPYPVAATIDPHDWWHTPAVARVIFTEYLKFLAVWVPDPVRGRPGALLGGSHHQRRSPVQAADDCRASLALELRRMIPAIGSTLKLESTFGSNALR
jgi:hypothetical protein